MCSLTPMISMRSPVRLAPRIWVPQAMAWRALKRRELNRLRWMDRPTGKAILRYEHCALGELVYLDVNKVGKVPRGGRWRIHGREWPKAKRRRKRRGHA